MSSKRKEQIIPIPGWILALLGAAVIYACAQITIPVDIGSVPITGQTFGVLVVGYFAGALWGPVAVILYILVAFLGLPVLSGDTVGLEILQSKSIGYLLGFILAAWLVAISGKWYQVLFWCIVAHVIILLFGGVGLIVTQDFSYEMARDQGVIPYAPGGAIKSVLATIVIVLGHSIFKKSKA